MSVSMKERVVVFGCCVFGVSETAATGSGGGVFLIWLLCDCGCVWASQLQAVTESRCVCVCGVGLLDYSMAVLMMQALSGSSSTILVRPPTNEPGIIGKVQHRDTHTHVPVWHSHMFTHCPCTLLHMHTCHPHVQPSAVCS